MCECSRPPGSGSNQDGPSSYSALRPISTKTMENSVIVVNTEQFNNVLDLAACLGQNSAADACSGLHLRSTRSFNHLGYGFRYVWSDGYTLMRQSQSLSRISRISNVKMDSGIFCPFIPALWSMMWTPRSSSTSAVARSQMVFLLKIQFVLCSLRLFMVSDIIVSVGCTSYASVYGALRGLYMAGGPVDVYLVV